MVHVIVQHKIGTWEQFDTIFRDDAERRKRLGSMGGKLFRSMDDPQSLFTVFEWADAKGAREFAEGLETHEAMEWATSGIWSKVCVVEEVYGVEA
jgi:hypothetical protein